MIVYTSDMPNRSKTVPIRMSEEEHERLAAAATRAGLGLGPWLRSLGLREAAAARRVEQIAVARADANEAALRPPATRTRHPRGRQ